MWKAFTEILEESGESTEIDEVERYLSEPIIDFHKSNCYTWWNDNSKRFPILSKLALKYLSAPSSGVRQVAFWGVFGHAKHEISRGGKPPSNPQNGGKPF